jgi:hypothetical protein
MDEKNTKRLNEVKLLDEQMQSIFKGEIDVSEFEPTANSLGTFSREIPEREYLFYEKNAFGIENGFLPSGETCLLAAAGGCGKTYLLMQAAIAAACGGTWLNAKAKNPIKVLFLAAEEKQDEIDRRAQAVANAMGLYKNTKLLELAKSNLRLFGRVGNNERLMTKEGEPRESYKKLKFFLEKNPDIKLVILDPAADYMAGEEEKDPAQAKDWTKLLSALTLLPGAPTILVAHHTRKDSNDSSVFKASEKDKIPDLVADSIRGSGGIVQSFRWAMLLDRREYDDRTEKVFLRVVKTNYTGKSGVLQFEPDKSNGGILKFKSAIEYDEEENNTNKASTPSEFRKKNITHEPDLHFEDDDNTALSGIIPFEDL